MNRRTLCIVVLAALIGGLSAQPVKSATAGVPAWLREPAASPDVLRTILSHRAKTPPEFFSRLRYALPDGTLQVMVRLARRTDAVERFVESSTSRLHWYGDGPSFYGRVDQQQLADLLRSDDVRFVEPDYPIVNFLSTATVDVNARTYEDDLGMWSFDGRDLQSELPGVSAAHATGKGVVVAHSDSGIDETHRDFDTWTCGVGASACQSRIIRKVVVDQVSGNDEDELGLPTSDVASGHGTHTAGIIAGNGFYSRAGDADGSYGADGHHFGVAPQASLISVKVGDSQSAALGVQALQWQLDHAAKYDIRLSNNSWGCMGGCSFSPDSAGALVLRRLFEADVLVTFAAGNDGGGPDGTAFNGLAQSPHVLSVAAYDDAQEQPAIADFSSRGVDGEPLPDPGTWTPEAETAGYRRPDLSAPGVDVWSAANTTGGTSSVLPRAVIEGTATIFPYVRMSGTSMSTPMVTGGAALLMSACPNASALEVMRSLMAGATTRQIMTTDGTRVALPYETGYGGLAVRASFDWLRTRPSCSAATGGETVTPRLDLPPAGIIREDVTFDASRSSTTTGTITDYEWDFGDGTSASGAVARHSFKKPGFYNVTLTVYDDSGSSASRRRTIAVSRPPTFSSDGRIQQGTYMATASEFIWQCPRMPTTQGLDGHVFELPDGLARSPQSISLEGVPGTDAGFWLYASVATGDCDFPVTAYTEGGHEVTLDLPPGARYIVAHARGGKDIDVSLSVYPSIPKKKPSG